MTGRDLAGFNLSPARVETLQMAQMETTVNRLPSAVLARPATIEFYVAQPRERADMPVTVEIGAADLSARLDGFYDAEQIGEASARWTRERANVQLPRMRAAMHGTLVLRLAAPRAASIAPPHVRVLLDGVEFGTTTALGAGFELVEIPLPDWGLTRLAAAPSILTMSVPTYVPADHGMGGDLRQLGAVVDWIPHGRPMSRRPWRPWPSGAMAAAGTGDRDLGKSWDSVATDWQGEEFPDGWRGHADAVNLALCARWGRAASPSAAC